MHCNCEMPVYGRITHLLMLAHDQTELTPMRHGIAAALTVVRKAHRRPHGGPQSPPPLHFGLPL